MSRVSIENSEMSTVELQSEQESGNAQEHSAFTEEAIHLVRSFTFSDSKRTETDGEEQELSQTNRNGSNTSAEPSGPIEATVKVAKRLSEARDMPAEPEYKPTVFDLLLRSKLEALERQRHSRREVYRRRRANVAAKFPARPQRSNSRTTGSMTPKSSPISPTAVKWYDKSRSQSSAEITLHESNGRTDLEKGFSTGVSCLDSGDQIIAQVADVIACRKYLIGLATCLIQFGAPSHRVEDYLRSSARALSIEAEFVFIPGATICSFIDKSTQANSIEIIRKNSGLDLGRLQDCFDVYKCVAHQKYSAEIGLRELTRLSNYKSGARNEFFQILAFALASVFVGPIAFDSRPIDFGPVFVLASIVGYLQIRIVPRCGQFANVFEVSACVLMAFISRGLGSITYSNGGYIFCFSSLAQCAIVLILPGFSIANAAFELQSKNIVSGSVRLVWTIIYVLFLSFGLMLGTTLFGLIKKDAVDDLACPIPIWFQPDLGWKLLYTRFLWVPAFACCIAVAKGANFRQLPMMGFIATAGYQASFWMSTTLSSNLHVVGAVGAFVVGCIAHLYSRLFHGFAAVVMLPAIFVQVPGGLAASGGLVAAANSSSAITGNNTRISVINNGTYGFVAAQDDPDSVYSGTIGNVAYGMTMVAIGISVGLYMSALLIYPLGKKKNGLSSF